MNYLLICKVIKDEKYTLSKFFSEKRNPELVLARHIFYAILFL